MIIESVTFGSPIGGVIVQTCVTELQFGSAAGMLKEIMSCPAVLLALMIAARSEPAVGPLLSPLSAVVVTVKVMPEASATGRPEERPSTIQGELADLSRQSAIRLSSGSTAEAVFAA